MTAPPDTLIPLRAGPLAAVFDPATGWLRRVRLGDREVLRAVYGAVRDRFWRTPPNRITNLTIREADGGFALAFDAECRLAPAAFAWRGTLTGGAAGTIAYRFDGEAKSAFLRNRIGLCVLHPAAECAGQPCRVEHPDGTAEDGRFPDAIAPHQPFHDIRALTHAVAEGVAAEVRFEGEVFECEDQRNWTDASFKTYGTPLTRPWPVEVAVGDRVVQSVTLRLHGAVSPARATMPEPPKPEVRSGGPTRARLPRIGLGATRLGRELTAREVEQLRALRPAHLRVDLVPGMASCGDKLRRATVEARALGTELEVALLADEPEQGFKELVDLVEQLRPQVAAWLVVRSINGTGTAEAVRLARRYLTPFTPSAHFGVGTNGYFTELNRQRPDPNDVDFVFYSLNPQVHAFDDLSVVETLDGQQWTAENARALAGGRLVAVTPVTLKPRFNPHAAKAGVALPAEEAEDDRLALPFAAAWTLASVRRLALAGVESLTYFETVGPCGVLGSPVYSVLADLAGLAGRSVDLCQCSRPLEVEALSVAGTTLIANLTPRAQTVSMTPSGGEVALDPYAVVPYLESTR